MEILSELFFFFAQAIIDDEVTIRFTAEGII
jgi:hypothetical protein